jgi:hypothetical protein
LNRHAGPLRMTRLPLSLRSPALAILALALALACPSCAERSPSACTAVDEPLTVAAPAAGAWWNLPGLRIRILNPGAKHLDAIVTRDTFNRLFPPTVWFQEGDVVGMYSRETKMTFLVVSEHAFDSWSDELSTIAERLCHEKAHRADDLYAGDQWSELRDTSGPGLVLDTHHFGHATEDPTPRSGAFMMTQEPAPASNAGGSADTTTPAPASESAIEDDIQKM